MGSFFKVAEGLEVAPLREALLAKPHLFGQKTLRADAPDSPHTQMQDIWVRYNDDHGYLQAGDFSRFSDEHDSVWYPVALEIPEVMGVVFSLMRLVNGERLGGVLITRLPPGGRIEKHIDEGWHAGYYHKFFVPLVNAPGALFRFEDGDIAPAEGEAWFFDNSVPHWVENGSDQDRIALIVCIKTHGQAMRERIQEWEWRLESAEPVTSVAEYAQQHEGYVGFDPQVQHHFSKGLYSKEIHIPRGHAIVSHAHAFDHLSFLGKGMVVLRTDDAEDRVVTAPACVNIRAGVHHAITALQDATWFCTHATDETDAEKVDRVLITREG